MPCSKSVFICIDHHYMQRKNAHHNYMVYLHRGCQRMLSLCVHCQWQTHCSQHHWFVSALVAFQHHQDRPSLQNYHHYHSKSVGGLCYYPDFQTLFLHSGYFVRSHIAGLFVSFVQMLLEFFYRVLRQNQACLHFHHPLYQYGLLLMW